MILNLDLIENTDETFCFDNVTLFDILNKTFRSSSGTYQDINQILAQVMIGITACFRFPGKIYKFCLIIRLSRSFLLLFFFFSIYLGQLNMDLRKLAVNMIPFPTLHFLMTSFSPLQTRQVARYINTSEHSLIKQMFNVNNQMLTFDTQYGKYLTATGIFRGRSLSLKLLHDLMAKEKASQHFISWIPNNVRRNAPLKIF